VEIVHTQSEQGTSACAARFAAVLKPGTVVLLSGDLGAGKTAFVRGMAAGLGLDPDEVNSPTFTLIQEYRGPRTLSHVDLYRVESAEIDELGLEELSESGAIVAIEWAEKLKRPPLGAIRVEILDKGEDEREIRISRDSERASAGDRPRVYSDR
jgi:tRNA threonylcarbamoyladenosine biosynthesis protein TsaE